MARGGLAGWEACAEGGGSEDWMSSSSEFMVAVGGCGGVVGDWRESGFALVGLFVRRAGVRGGGVAWVITRWAVRVQAVQDWGIWKATTCRL